MDARRKGPLAARRMRRCLTPLGLLLTASLLAPASAQGGPAPNSYHRVNLVSDIPGKARITDPDLVNPWGMAAGATTPVWVADNGADAATIYAGAAHGQRLAKVPLTVSIPGGAPTGQVFNRSHKFVVHAKGASGPALFLFSSETGIISGWNPAVPAGSTTSTRAVRAASTPDAVYKGLAIAHVAQGMRLYAANFYSGHIDVFDGHFKRIKRPGAFIDPRLPDGYAPFNIERLRGRLYVSYAKQDASREDDVAGPGHGFIDIYDLRGRLVKRFASRGVLDSPWGLELAPSRFGRFSGALLVGNFGDGRISAFSPWDGRFLGQMRNRQGRRVEIDGLWALRFGNGVTGTRRTLLFTAGIDDEAHGLFGRIRLSH